MSTKFTRTFNTEKNKYVLSVSLVNDGINLSVKESNLKCVYKLHMPKLNIYFFLLKHGLQISIKEFYEVLKNKQVIKLLDVNDDYISFKFIINTIKLKVKLIKVCDLLEGQILRTKISTYENDNQVYVARIRRLEELLDIHSIMDY